MLWDAQSVRCHCWVPMPQGASSSGRMLELWAVCGVGPCGVGRVALQRGTRGQGQGLLAWWGTHAM